jgi:hypothetical protein
MSKLLITTTALALIPLASTSTSAAKFKGCRFRASASIDGCAGAPQVSGAHQHYEPKFFTLARQSGQTYVDLHPMKWNVPGVDYPVGINWSEVPGGALKAISLIGSDPAAPGCGYNATTHSVGCSSTTQPVVINGYDWSNGEASGCTTLDTSGSSTGSLTISNNYIPGLNSAGPCLSYTDSVMHIFPTGQIVFRNNDFAGRKNLWTNTAGVCFAFLGSSAGSASPSLPIIIQYNAFMQPPVRAFCSEALADINFKYNYLDGMVWREGQAHGETIQNSGAAGTNIGNQWYEYNTFLQPSTTYASATTPGVNAFVSITLTPTETVTNFYFDHIVAIANLPTVYPGHASVGQAVAASSTTSNMFLGPEVYLDPTGLYNCFYVAPPTNVTEEGVSDLRDGSAIVGGLGIPGNRVCNGY